jgi:hypothetical protein
MKHRKKIALGAALTAALAGSAFAGHKIYKHHQLRKMGPMTSSGQSASALMPWTSRLTSPFYSLANKLKRKQEGGRKRRGPGRPRRVGRPKSRK